MSNKVAGLQCRSIIEKTNEQYIHKNQLIKITLPSTSGSENNIRL